jgi:hypothetical protein
MAGGLDDPRASLRGTWFWQVASRKRACVLQEDKNADRQTEISKEAHLITDG